MTDADTDAHTANLLGALAVACVDLQGEILEAHGLDAAAGAALLGVHARRGSNVGDIAQTTGLTHSGAVRTISRLEKPGLVRSVPGDDRRTVHLHCTARGAALARRLLKQRRRTLERMLGRLSQTDSERFGAIAATLLAGCPADRADARRICRFCEHAVCRDDRCPVGSVVA